MSGRTRVGVATAGIAVLALLAAGCGGGGDEAAGTPKVEVSGAPETANAHAGHHMLKARQSLSVPEITEQGARGEILEAFWDYYRVQVQTQHKMDPVLPEYSAVMVGEVLTKHSKSISKYKKRGWKIFGAPEITGVEILETKVSSGTPQAVVGACVDDENWTAAAQRPRLDPGEDVEYTRVGVAKVSGVWKAYDEAHEPRDKGRCG